MTAGEAAPRPEQLNDNESPKDRADRLMDPDRGRKGLTFSDFLNIAKGVVGDDFSLDKFSKGGYSDDVMKEIEARMEEMKAKNAPVASGTSEASAEAFAAGGSSAEGPQEEAVLEGRHEDGGGRRYEAAGGGVGRSKKIGKWLWAAAAAAATVTVAGAVALTSGGGAKDAKDPAQEQKNEAEAEAGSETEDAAKGEETTEDATSEDEAKKDAEDAEEKEDLIDLSDNYEGYADETGRYLNSEKETPFSFGPEYKHTTKEDLIDYLTKKASGIREELSVWYSVLPEELKSTDTKGLNMIDTEKKVESDDGVSHRQVFDKFLEIINDEEKLVDVKEIGISEGWYVNPFLYTTGGNGNEINHKNTEPRYDISYEKEGTKALLLTFDIGGGKTATVMLREECGLQPIFLLGTNKADEVIATLPPIETPPNTPPEENKGKTAFSEEELFRKGDELGGGADAGNSWEKDTQATSDANKTNEKPAEPTSSFNSETGNYTEPAPQSEESQHAEQQTQERRKPAEKPAEQKPSGQQSSGGQKSGGQQSSGGQKSSGSGSKPQQQSQPAKSAAQQQREATEQMEKAMSSPASDNMEDW